MKWMLIKYSSEISLKGLNRKSFEDMLVRNIKKSIGKEYNIMRESGRMYIDTYSEELAEKLSKVFGVIAVAEADVLEKDIETIGHAAAEQLRALGSIRSFKVESRRADKSFPLNSIELSQALGGVILRTLPDLKVDIHNPEITVSVEIRDKAFVYSAQRRGTGGMPYGTAGKGVLLLSGGIDSPVAGYMLAKRGLSLVAVYYHSHPYTSERAKEKVIDLAKKLVEYTGSMKLYTVPFTRIQMEIIEKCREAELTIIMRRFMTKIAEEIAIKEGAMALVTGESLAQVASQTLESIYVTNSSLSMPVFRPLIGMDKIEIMDMARKINTYDTSILPYEDCCTIFVPKHPKTKPRLSDIEESEGLLDKDALIAQAIENAEILEL